MPAPFAKTVRVHRRNIPQDAQGRQRYSVLRDNGTAYHMKLVPPSPAAIDAALKAPTMAERFRAVREAHGLSMHELARALGTVHQVIMRIEAGAVKRSRIVNNLATIAGLAADDVIRGRVAMTTVDRGGTLAERVRTWRLVNSLTRKEAVAAIGGAMTYVLIHDIETERRNVSAAIVRLVESRIHGHRA